MRTPALITPELRNVFYNILDIDQTSSSGLRWKVSQGKIRLGQPGGTLRQDGYWQVSVKYKLYQNHRIVWALAYNQDPGILRIDHIDGNRSNNHPENLRLATAQQNQWNRSKLAINNTSGFTGVSWREDKLKWRSRIKLGKKEINLGLFETIEEAIIARKKAEVLLFGEFAPIR